MKKVVTFILYLLMIISFTSSIEAKTTVDANWSSMKEHIKVGEDVVVTLSFENYTDVTKGFNAFKATLEYDENVFEKVSEKNFTLLNDWEELKYNAATKEFVAIKKAGSKTAENVVQISLKVKKDAKAGIANVRVVNLVTSEGNEDIFFTSTQEDATNVHEIKLNIIKEQGTIPTSNKNDVSNNSNNNNISNNSSHNNTNSISITNNSDNNSNNNENKNDNTLNDNRKENKTEKDTFTIEDNKNDDSVKKKSDGFNISGMFIAIITIPFLLGIIIYFIILRRKRNDLSKKDKMFLFLFALSIVSIQVTGVIFATALSKGDINQDGKIDYADIELLEYHLIHVSGKELVDDSYHDADMNRDGKLSVTDLSLAVQKVEKTLDYNVVVSNVETKNYYPKKNEEVTIKFSATAKYNARVTSVMIDEKEYEVEKVGQEYQVKVPAPSYSGLKTFNITSVTLYNGHTKKINEKVVVDVQKDKPIVANYLIKENPDKEMATIFLDVEDHDQSLTAGIIQILNKDTGTEILNKVVNVGNNTLEFKVQENIKYLIKISLNYDLATNELEQKQDCKGVETYLYDYKFAYDYNFEISNVKTYNNQTEKTIFEKEEKITVGFNSSNNSESIPNKVTINDKEYNVSKNENRYEVQLDGFKDSGVKELKITSVTLSNNKKFDVSKNLKIEILKDPISFSDYAEEYNIESSNATLKFNIVDKDNAFVSGKAILLNKTDNTTQEKDILVGQNALAFNIKEDVDYSLKINATYARDIEKQNVVNETLKTTDLKFVHDYELNVTELKTYNSNKQTVYFNKKEDVIIGFNSTNNTSFIPTKAVINGIEYTLNKVENQYQANIGSYNKNGIIDIKLEKITLQNGKQFSANLTTKIEVLKNLPKIDAFSYQVKKETNQVEATFMLLDEDNAITSGTITIFDNNGNQVYENPILTTGKNTIHFNKTTSEFYDVIVKANYDLDTNSLETVNEEDNRVTNETIFTKKIELVADYNVKINNIKTYNGETESKYFEKEKPIDLTFESTNATDYNPIKAIINGEEYDLTNTDGVYKTQITGYNTIGIKEIKIEGIILDNTKHIPLDGNDLTKIEILKEKPRINNFDYEVTEEGKIKVMFNVTDNDKTITSGNIVIKDEYNQEIVNKEMKVGENLLALTMNESDIYTVTISAQYDLDTNALDSNSNQYSEELLNEQISSLTNVIELKNVISTELYDSANNRISVLDITGGIPTNLEDYYVKINMKSLPTYYASVKSIKKDSNKLNITIDQTNFIMYKENGSEYNKINNYTFQMAYKDEEGKHSLVKTANELFEQIGKNPSGNFILTEDLDASTVTNNPAIPYTFKGTLDGAGHKIINLSSALFQELNHATVKNLVIENARITNNSKGILANNINNNSLVENVHIKDSTLSNNEGTVGSFTGQIASSTIKESSAINVNISANNTVGGIVGTMANGSIVENCYVTGTIKGTYNHNTLGSRIGGIAGWHSGNKIDHCYTNVTLIAPRELGSGGLVGGPNGHPVIKNSVSLGSGKGYRISGFNMLDNMENVYEYAKSSSLTSIVNETTNVKSITDIYDKNFYQHTLGFNEDIWNLDLLEHNKLPNLKKDPMPNQIDQYEIKENKNNIPNYDEVRNNRDYIKDKEIVYYNLSKLMPFENTKNWIKMANSISTNSLLSKSKIKFILPLGDEDKLIMSLGRNETNKIKKIRVIYTNDQAEDFPVTYKQTIEDLVAVYKMNDLKIEYQFDHYLSNISEKFLRDATELANNLDYSSDIASITSENESRLYVDFYNENVKENIRDIIYNYLSNETNIPTYSNNKIVKASLNAKLTEDKLIRLLYAYNYYEKWYHIDLDGVKISDLMFFNGTKLNSSMTTTYMINSVIDTNTNNRATNKTVDFYDAFINKKVGKTLPDFLTNLFKTINGYNNPSDWLVDHFDGLIYEQPAISPISDEITYRIWPIMTGSSRNMHMLLPILSAPQEDMYLISCPSQYIIGSLNRYSTYLNKDGKERDRMLNLMKNYGMNLGRFYGVSSSFIPNAAERINNIINVQFDTRFNFPASSKANGGTQESGTTKEPVMKWVYEAVGNAWGAANGAGAYADGDNVWWIVDAALGYDRAVHVFTHETAHNQDNRFFYSGNGRRPNTGAEAHADGVISQDISTYTTVFNLTKNFALDSDYATNLSYERINSAEKIHSYYKEMYETKYVLEYLAAQAFLKLTPKEQAKIAVQQQHNIGVNYTTNYVRLTENQIREMNLKTIEDLWDNKLAIRNTGTSPHTWNGSYGHDSLFNLYFYIPNNPEGTSDTTTFKNTGYEMLGYAGYDKGFITYMSGRSANDLVAIKKITSDDTMTWKRYKMSRYENVRKNLNKVNYYDTNVLIDLYKRAFEADAKNNNLNVSQAVTKLYYGIVKRATNDFSTDGIYTINSQISITSASQFINLLNSNTTGNYRLDADLDFSTITVPEEQDSYIKNKFIGIIDGNGHKLTGVKYTLFNDIAYAGIKNITIERPTYIDSTTASIAKNGKSFDLYNVKVNNSNLSVLHVANKSGMYFSSDTNTTTTRSTEISSVEDLQAIGKSSVGLKKSYILTTDIDLSNVSKTGNPIIPGTFSGNIDGNGHKISNTKDVLFNSITGTIKNLKIENANITSNNAKGIFSNSLSNATIESISINDSKIINNASGVGGLTGGITSSTVNKISLTNITVKADNTIGGLAGQISSGTVQNILFTGKVEGTTSSVYNLGSRAAGITGWLNSNATIKSVVTKAEINGYGKKGNGGIIGGPNSGNSNIINSISLSAGTNAYRIAGFNTLNNVNNVYEYALSNSTTNINDNSKVLLATEEDIKTSSFYINSVKLDSEIWNFDDVSTGGIPKLTLNP